jgi:hypothetical protein
VAQPRPVAAIMLMAPSGKVLMLRRADSGQWLFPAGRIGPGETPEDAGWRAVFASTQYRLGDAGQRLMRRVKDDGEGVGDATTFMCMVDNEFQPVLSGKHDQFVWMLPKDVVKAAKNAGPDPTDPDAQFLADLEGSA